MWLGYVYLVHDVDGGRYKVGRTSPMVARDRVLILRREVAGAFRVVWVVASNSAGRLEAECKRRWASKCVGGEWFDLTADDVKEFCSVRVVNYRGRKPVEYRDPFPPPRRVKAGRPRQYTVAVGELVGC